MSDIKFIVGSNGVKFALNSDNVNFKFVQQKINFAYSTSKVVFQVCENKIIFRLGTGNNHWDIGTHTHVEADITDLDKYSQAAIDIQQAIQDQALLDHKALPDAHHPKMHAHDGIDGSGTIEFNDLTGKPTEYPPTTHGHDAVEIDYDNKVSNLSAIEVQAAIDELKDILDKGINEWTAIANAVADPNEIWNAVNAMDWTGHEHADNTITTALRIDLTDVVSFGNASSNIYRWIGPKNITLGIGGDYLSTSFDYQITGTTDHTSMVNRDAINSHPISAITGLVAEQARQDQDLIDHEIVSNPHGTTHQELTDRASLDSHPMSAITGLVAEQGQQDANLQAHIDDILDPHNVQHEQLGNILPDDHHNELHAHDGVDGSGTIAYADLTDKPVIPPSQTYLHSDLTDVSENQHHNKVHIHDGLDGSGQVDYSNLVNPPTIPPAQTYLHADLTDITQDQHHAKSHAHNGVDGSGTVSYNDLANQPTIPPAQTYLHSDLTDIGTDDHHAKSHTHDGADGSGQVEYSSILNPPVIPPAQTYLHADLTDVDINDHHNKSHIHDGLDGSGVVDYSNLINIPASFPPNAHTHAHVDLTNRDAADSHPISAIEGLPNASAIDDNLSIEGNIAIGPVNATTTHELQFNINKYKSTLYHHNATFIIRVEDTILMRDSGFVFFSDRIEIRFNNATPYIVFDNSGLTLNADATSDMQAVTKQQMEAITDNKVAKNGDSMSGNLTMNSAGANVTSTSLLFDATANGAGGTGRIYNNDITCVVRSDDQSGTNSFAAVYLNAANNLIQFLVDEVTVAKISKTALFANVTHTIDLGTNAVRWKDGYFQRLILSQDASGAMEAVTKQQMESEFGPKFDAKLDGFSAPNTSGLFFFVGNLNTLLHNCDHAISSAQVTNYPDGMGARATIQVRVHTAGSQLTQHIIDIRSTDNIKSFFRALSSGTWSPWKEYNTTTVATVP